ncbi:unnamed protein product [Pleuronectes platessa]|uniref:Uncharacterized protein n=1 Tax=Pleuronectes platessa TaxID=8262 RepID=A0A9N7V755_PLEPL|nr:unnamed protein product [Pleuronectes platessa]
MANEMKTHFPPQSTMLELPAGPCDKCFFDASSRGPKPPSAASSSSSFSPLRFLHDIKVTSSIPPPVNHCSPLSYSAAAALSSSERQEHERGTNAEHLPLNAQEPQRITVADKEAKGPVQVEQSEGGL